MAQTAAQEEFASILSKASANPTTAYHPDDDTDYAHDTAPLDQDEEDEYRQRRIDENMRLPSLSSGTASLRLPHPKFDEGRTTGVKGVIADARSFQEARKAGPRTIARPRPQASSNNNNNINKRVSTFLNDAGEDSDEEADEQFLERWRQQRRMEMEREGAEVRNRRTSPSVRRWGRMDQVDALGYLDAIEKVGRETTVVVFVYDDECPVSAIISEALAPLVSSHHAIHFVKVHYADIEFDNAGVPALLAYKNQGDLFANLTYIVDQIPPDTPFDTDALEHVLRQHNVL